MLEQEQQSVNITGSGHKIAQVIVQVPTQQTDQHYSYLIPQGIDSEQLVGARVVVPFAGRKVQGYVLEVTESIPTGFTLKEIEKVLDPLPPLTRELIQLGEWMAKEYVCFQITAFEAMLPAVLKATANERKVNKKKLPFAKLTIKKDELPALLEQLPARASKQKAVLEFLALASAELTPLQEVLAATETYRSTVQSLVDKGYVEIVEQEVWRDPYAGRTFRPSEPMPLTIEQQNVFQRMTASLDQNLAKTFLLHGVTGSGKTEVYLQLIAHVLQQEKEAIVLVPEIALTPQMVERFKSRFGEQVAVLHSRLSAGERYDEWRKIRTGKVNVAIGARSALFAPFTKLGLIIIDEEHESSYKQEESPKYHARDVAIYRAQREQAVVLLGSATPSLESYARAQRGVYQLLELKQRVHGQTLPPVKVIDMRQELYEGNRSMFSRELYQALEERLAKKEQTVLFLNRRGFSTFIMCRDCGYVASCPHCDISLTFHKINQTCRCHYCGYTERLIHTCPHCQSEHIRHFGTGTQKVEEELTKLFPGIRIIRMDVDTTQRKGAHERLLTAFKEKKADVLLGTQMIAKGLDFEQVTLVGVIAVDSMLHLPDFRAAERTFQLLTQVSGRAGRHRLPGEVIMQTYTPEHYSIQCASQHDYAAFFQMEMHQRKQRGYSPYFYLAMLTFTHEDLPYLVKVAEQNVSWLKQHLSTETILLGPVPAPIPRIKDRYRYQCMIKYKNEPNLTNKLRELLEKNQQAFQKNNLIIQIDVRP